MPKYKDAEPILAKLEEFAQSTCDSSYEDGIRIAMQVINEPPAADVQEVKHGKWQDKSYYPLSLTRYHTCSVCNKEFKITFSDNYYPNCGARMDGKEQSNDGLSEQETPKAEH